MSKSNFLNSHVSPLHPLRRPTLCLWRAPQEENGFLYFQVEGHPSQFHFFYLPINRNANSLLQSSKLRAEANSEATLFHLGIYSVFYSGNRFALECYHNCVIKSVIESVIEFGALWKEVNPAAIFFSALQFTQPSDWSRFLLLAFTLFISRTRFYFIYFRQSLYFIYFLALALLLFISRTRFKLFTFRTRTTFIYFNALLLYHV